MEIQIGFSPCPNDTFIFDALVNGKIDTGGLTFKPVMEDVQALNLLALEGKLPFTKISYGVYPKLTHQYFVLNAGSALGRGVGPLLIKHNELVFSSVDEMAIAIPGEHTTAHMLFSMAYPKAKNKVFLRYDEIEAFAKAKKGLGVIIHENRFTYAEKGLEKITDLGQYWEEKTNNPIPLGGIVALKSIDSNIRKQVDYLIAKSIAYAYNQYPQLSDFIRCHAQEMSEDVMRKHIELYVNDYSASLGDVGKNAILKMMEVYTSMYANEDINTNIFSTEN